MKVVILAGGYGTRISEESQLKPKPMIEIGEFPIIWHIMKIYSAQGFNDFIICAGYKQHLIKEWFSQYFLHRSDVTFDYKNDNEIKIHHNKTEPWKVTVVDTGLNTQTGGRVKRIQDYIGNETFLLTYGDAVGDIDINKIVQVHKNRQKTATVTVYNYSQNKGVLDISNDGVVNDFREKSGVDSDLINIGFFVFEPRIFNYIEDDNTILEHEPFAKLVKEKQLISYKHDGFWQCMDTLKEKQKLESFWNTKEAPWKIWKD